MRAPPALPAPSPWRAAILAIAACGGSSGPPPGPPAIATVLATPRLTADDVEVATVNGRTVWASCVTAQAAGLAEAHAGVAAAPAAPPAGPAAAPAAHPAGPAAAPAAHPAGPAAAHPAAPAAPDPAGAVRAAALEQCIAFELLAQAAEARGLAAAPEVAEATRRAAVNRLVETDFEARYRGPADLKQVIDLVVQKNEWRMHLIELRASTYARFKVPAHAPPELDARAHALADRLAGELAGQTGLYSVHLTEAARRIADGSGVELETSDYRAAYRGDLVDSYAAALYAIPAVGQSSPAFRTQWGWDVVMWTGGVEAKERSRDELVAEMFPELRRRQFQLWVTQLGKQLGVHVEVDPATVARLDTSDAPGAAP